MVFLHRHLFLYFIVEEISINERSNELRQKEESIRQMEKIIQEKSESIASLQSDIESLQVIFFPRSSCSFESKIVNVALTQFKNN